MNSMNLLLAHLTVLGLPPVAGIAAYAVGWPHQNGFLTHVTFPTQQEAERFCQAHPDKSLEIRTFNPND